MRSLIAVGLAGVIVGGLGGTTVTALVTHDDGPSHSSNVEGGFRGGPGPMPRPEGRPGGADEEQPALPPEEQDDPSDDSGD